MDLGTDYYCHVAGAPLALLWSLTQVRCLTMLESDKTLVFVCCLPRRMSSEPRGEAFIGQAGDNVCMMKGRLLQIVRTQQTGRGTITQWSGIGENEVDCCKHRNTHLTVNFPALVERVAAPS